MLIKHGLSDDIIKGIFDKCFISYDIKNDEIEVNIFHKSKAQECINEFYIKNKDNNKTPSLLPVQFYYLLSKTGLYDSMKILLDNIKQVDIHKFSYYSGYLYGARFYEYEKALAMYLELKHKLIDLDQTLNYTEEEIKEIWMEAYNI